MPKNCSSGKILQNMEFVEISFKKKKTVDVQRLGKLGGEYPKG